MPRTATMPAKGKAMNDQLRATSSLLHCLRTLLGLNREEARLVLGGLPEGEMKNIERAKTHFVNSHHLRTLSAMLERVEALLDNELDRDAPPPFLITYATDPDLAEFDPDLQKWMMFSSVHRMFTARLWNDWRAMGKATSIIALVPPDYLAFLQTMGYRDSQESMMRWAAGYVLNYKIHDRPPKVTGLAEQTITERTTFHKREE